MAMWLSCDQPAEPSPPGRYGYRSLHESTLGAAAISDIIMPFINMNGVLDLQLTK